VAYIDGLVSEMVARHGVDPSRVYALGRSNGGFLAHRLACEESDRFRAVVSISGAGPMPDERCRPSSSVAVLQIHGSEDRIVPYDGGHVFGDTSLPAHPSAEATVRDWAQRLGCSDTDAGELDLSGRYPGAETRIERFTGCRRGVVELWTVRGGDHYLDFGADGFDAIWSFFESQGS
jgi:polyhydroxybutyrate depolymerase